MQIGCCWFDNEQRLLIDQVQATQWHLNDHEYWVLNQLSLHRGQVVPLSVLEVVAVSGGEVQRLSHSELINIINTITNYLCGCHANLIEYIPEQGVILYANAISKHTKVLDLPNRLLSFSQYTFIVAVLLSVLLFVYSSLNPPLFIQADVLRQILTSEGNITHLSIFAADDNQHGLDLHADGLTTQLRQCQNLPWDTITAALSSDQHNISIILKNKRGHTGIVHNVKVNFDDIHSPFITQDWLKKVGICG